MKQLTQKQYSKPRVTAHGSVEEVTGHMGRGAREFIGGTQTKWSQSIATSNKCDLGS